MQTAYGIGRNFEIILRYLFHVVYTSTLFSVTSFLNEDHINPLICTFLDQDGLSLKGGVFFRSIPFFIYVRNAVSVTAIRLFKLWKYYEVTYF